MRVTILTTGGTIEKTYDETDGSLRNSRSVVDHILQGLRLPTLQICHVPVMTKDSLEMTDEDRDHILEAVRETLRGGSEAALVVHGTDTLEVTGAHLEKHMTGLAHPVVLTGAMRPYEFRDTDAFQNLTEALLACRILEPGVYVVIHNQALRFPGVVKDRRQLTFIKPSPLDA